MWRRKRLTCVEPDGRCELSVARSMVYNSPDGKVFRVRRLVCAICGRQERVVKEQDAAFVPPSWLEDGVEANF